MSKVFTFAVRENRNKWLVLAAFSAGLLILGFVAGRVFTGVRAGSGVMIVGLALSSGATGVSGAEQSQTDSSAVLKVESATVGKPSLVRWKLSHGNGAGDRSTMLTLTVTHLEKQKVVFGVEKITVDDEWSMKIHFPDAGEYRVSAVGSIPGLAAVRNEQVIAVTGAEPPATAMFPALAYFVALITVGLGAGRWSKRHGASV